MKIALMSDLHLEFEREADREPAPEDHPYRIQRGQKLILGPDLNELRSQRPDLLVLAGDIDAGLSSFAYARMAGEYLDCPVIMVPGNHEYYGYNIQYIRDLLAWESQHDPKVFVLDNDGMVIGGIRFVGATLWTDFGLNGSAEDDMARVERAMNDYKQIRVGEGPGREQWISADDTLSLNRECLSHIKRIIAEPFGGPTVVITHHGPHPNSLGGKRDRDVAPAYASDLSWLIERYRPDLWMHGHVHIASNYWIGTTRVACNPRGYFPDRLVDGFKADLIVEI